MRRRTILLVLGVMALVVWTIVRLGGPISESRARQIALSQNNYTYQEVESASRTQFQGVDAWEVVIHSTDISNLRATVWIDASTGKVLRMKTQAHPD